MGINHINILEEEDTVIPGIWTNVLPCWRSYHPWESTEDLLSIFSSLWMFTLFKKQVMKNSFLQENDIFSIKTCKTFVEIEKNKSANNWIKGSNSFDGMVACKWQDPIDFLQVWNWWYILEKGYIEHNDHFSTNSEFDVFEASVDDEWARISDRWQL